MRDINNVRFSFQTYRYKPLFFRPGFTLIAVLLHPKSRGRITLNSRYVEDQPVIEPNYFSHPEDVKTLTSGIRLASRMGVSDPYKVNFLSDINSRKIFESKSCVTTFVPSGAT